MSPMQKLKNMHVSPTKVDSTSVSVEEKSPVVVFSPEVCEGIVEYLRKQPFPRWFHRNQINSVPVKRGDFAADYYFMGDRQMASEDEKFFLSVSPLVDGEAPAEIGFNMYKPGNFMPEHIDRALYRYTMVIQLCGNGDGIEIEGKFYEDIPGRAVIFPASSPPHAVPRTKHLRFVMLCLYK